MESNILTLTFVMVKAQKVSGTCGSIIMKVHGSGIPKPQQLIPMSPSGVQKERMHPDDVYVLSGDGSIISSPSPKPYPHKPPKCSDCAPLFMKATIMNYSLTDVLFPYARDNVRRHLSVTYNSAKTQDDIKLLRSQVEDDLKQGVLGAIPIPSEDAGKEEVIVSLVANVEAMIKANRKFTALKQLQGHIWRTGFKSNELEGVVFDDVPEALEKWHALGIKVYIYSSISRLAQRLIFGNTNYGDLRKYLSGFFDTAVGETQSYVEITESLGVDKPSDILFVIDVYQEATAAKATGSVNLEVVISIRPGNNPLPENHGFKTINSFLEI
ncbi:hypothetical protein PVK06_048902 [Gossypium arboreum]|uniref:Bifunctional methylthioribulose-1-phosphate dehydratase/enolase-phosphatase E1 n=1 Tax=Gossypium arboreum TaxID=29729 RepID=A0ABR0MJV0_GOSAR|nr:hypothetical protein PVK06_048902 [Gossypium arboreum]